MLFNSYEYIFIFLPLTLAGFFCIGARSHKAAAAFLAVASFAFYSWWDPHYVGLLAVSASFNFLVGRTLAARPNGRHLLLAVGVAANLVMLGWYKYANFFVETVVTLTGAEMLMDKIILPLGISFFTFTQIAFLVDAYRGQAREYSPVHFALFVSFFPHLIAGPILHHKEMMPQFASDRPYRPHWDSIAAGLSLFALGLFKKVVVADGIAPFANDTFAAAGSTAIEFFQGWSGALAYTLQIYFDFSGYSDMAVGSALLFGIRLPVNFNSPYKATNIIDFWRRWHMTLSRFLRDYLYVPLGGNRVGPSRTYINLMAVMLLGGLWHGAGWTFVIWGGLHGFYLLINHAWRNLFPGGTVSRLGKTAAWVTTFVAVVVAWVFFRATDTAAALAILKGMAGLNGFLLGEHHRAYLGPLVPVIEQMGISFGVGARFSFLAATWIIACLVLVLVLPNTQQWILGEGRRHAGGQTGWFPSITWAVALGVVALVAIGFISGQSEFLYFNF